MKVRVKSPFFDNKGLHKKGEIVEVSELNPTTMEPVIDEEKATEAKVETATKKEPKKTIRTKKVKE